ncbi:MotE family protein [Chachezhania antarctica]|uniref:MotE family protein n=1 Tax=Chachezhania antarctica TaxID=2340860 RepID=UPI000EB177A6|nr:hypothetical protein [Chachezhania antarctica]|tara:strand:+ start:101 stop:715 length:615 start_codon:yes stop_codon:yes gene_type:complete
MSKGKDKTRAKRPAVGRRGALVMLSLLLISSAVLRVGTEAGPALAEVRSGASTTGESGGGDTGGRAVASEDVGPMIAALQARERALEKRELQIEDRMKALAIAERSVREKIDAMVAAEERLTATLSLAETASEDDIARLTSVYEQMKPKQSAQLFSQMDAEFAAGFLSRMKPEAAAGILAGMDPQTAYTISVVLAGRNARAPTE